jgi:hypothetical protein
MAGFDCEAYGPEGTAVGALCFVSPEQGRRVCESAEVCHAVMTEQRQMVFSRIQEQAAAGDETAVYLAGEFTSPDQLLGGGESDDGQPS